MGRKTHRGSARTKRPRCARAAQAFFFPFAAFRWILRARSTGSTVLRMAAQPMACARRCAYSSHNPSTACPSGYSGSIGHSYAMLRQQAPREHRNHDPHDPPQTSPRTSTRSPMNSLPASRRPKRRTHHDRKHPAADRSPAPPESGKPFHSELSCCGDFGQRN